MNERGSTQGYPTVAELAADVIDIAGAVGSKYPDDGNTLTLVAGLLTDQNAEIERLRRQVGFLEALADGGPILVNGVPWREIFDRLNAIVSDPVEPIGKPSTPNPQR